MITAWPRLSEAKAGLTGKVTIAVGERDLVVLEPDALAAEQDADGLARRDQRRGELRGLRRIDHGLGLVVRPRRGRQHQRAVGDRLLERVVKHRVVEDAVGAGGHLARLRVRPGLAAA